jgi:hypothetical protein
MRLCACNHFETSHSAVGCLGRYLLPTGATERCTCSEFRPLTDEQTAAMDELERLCGGVRPPAS